MLCACFLDVHFDKHFRHFCLIHGLRLRLSSNQSPATMDANFTLISQLVSLGCVFRFGFNRATSFWMLLHELCRGSLSTRNAVHSLRTHLRISRRRKAHRAGGRHTAQAEGTPLRLSQQRKTIIYISPVFLSAPVPINVSQVLWRAEEIALDFKKIVQDAVRTFRSTVFSAIFGSAFVLGTFIIAAAFIMRM